MTTFLLVRHGTTDAVGKRLTGQMAGFPLNEAGIAQARRLADRLAPLSIAAFYTSPLQRALETAALIAAPHGSAPVLRDRLTDIDFGEWTGKPIAELACDEGFHRFNTQRSTARPPGGESMAAVQARVLDELLLIGSAHPESTVVVVGHADPWRMALAYFLGVPLDMAHRIEVAVGSLCAVRLTPYGATLLAVNDTGVLAL